jgi:hypothetical protein
MGGKQGGRVWEGGAARGAREARSVNGYGATPPPTLISLAAAILVPLLYVGFRAALIFRWIKDTMVRMSSASCSDTGHSIFGLCAHGFLIVPNSPIRRFAKPRCSPLSVSVYGSLIAKSGLSNLPNEKAAVTRSAPSLVSPVMYLIVDAILFISSNAAWK